MKQKMLLWAAFVAATLPPWLIWLDLNALALRFVQLRGHWPMCDTALPCLPRIWSDADTIDTMSAYDPIRMRFEPNNCTAVLLLCSVPAWLVLHSAFGKHLPLVARRVFLIAFVLGWAFLILDPTRVVSWYAD